MTKPTAMPELPEPDYWSTRDDDTPLYTADQMRAYALAALQSAQPAAQDGTCSPCEGEPMSARKAAYFMQRFKREEKLLGPNEQLAIEFVLALLDAQPAEVPVPMTEKWCWWLGDGEGFQIVDTESEAHGEAQSSIDDDCDPGQTHQYSIARVQHPIDALGMGWLAEHVAESIAENACCWCDENTGAEEPSIMLSADDKRTLGIMVAGFLRQRVGVDWWTTDQKTVRLHTYVSGSNDGAPDATAAQQGADTP